MAAKPKQRKNHGTPAPMNVATIPLDSRTVAERVADALRRGYGNTKSAVKEIGRATFANDRSAANWFEGRCAPNAADLIELMRECDEVFDEVMRLAGRADSAQLSKLRGDLDEIAAVIEKARGG